MVVILAANTSWYLYNFRAGLIRSLISRGYTVVTAAPRDSHTYLLEELGVIFCHVHMDNRGINPLKDALTVVQYIVIGRRHRPDCWLNFTIKPVIYGAIAGYLTGARVISTITGLGTSFLHRKRLAFLVELMYRLTQRLATKIFFQNEEDREFFQRKRLIEEEKADLVPGSGIDVEKFTLRKLPNEENFRFLMIARLLWDKGVAEYVEAARVLGQIDCRLIFQIVGRIETESEEAVPSSELNRWVDEELIVYLGESDDIRRQISQADCVVLPSYREGLPRALLEASAMGRPVIAADAPGSRSVVIDGQTGLLCEARSASSLIRCMKEMSQKDFDDRREMGCAGRKFVEEKFREEFVIDKYLRVLTSLSSP